MLCPVDVKLNNILPIILDNLGTGELLSWLEKSLPTQTRKFWPVRKNCYLECRFCFSNGWGQWKGQWCLWLVNLFLIIPQICTGLPIRKYLEICFWCYTLTTSSSCGMHRLVLLSGRKPTHIAFIPSLPIRLHPTILFVRSYDMIEVIFLVHGSNNFTMVKDLFWNTAPENSGRLIIVSGSSNLHVLCLKFNFRPSIGSRWWRCIAKAHFKFY